MRFEEAPLKLRYLVGPLESSESSELISTMFLVIVLYLEGFFITEC